MHSPHYLANSDFTAHTGAGAVPGEALFTDWSEHARVVVVAPDPAGDLQAVAGPVLLWTYRFYERLRARVPDYFDYPSHYVMGGTPGAEPRWLGPSESAPWSGGWCRIDIWPSIRHGVAEPEPASMLAAVMAVQPSHLLWPAHWPWPRNVEIGIGPGDRVARGLLRARLEGVFVYGDEARAGPTAWRLSWRGGAAQLTEEARLRLPDAPPPAERAVWLAPVPIESFLGPA